MLNDAPEWAQTFPGAVGLIIVGAIIGTIFGLATVKDGDDEIQRAWEMGGFGAAAGLLIWFVFLS